MVDVAQHPNITLMTSAEVKEVKGFVGNFEASIGEFQSALDRAPDAVEPLSQLVKSHLALKQKDQAVAVAVDIFQFLPVHQHEIRMAVTMELLTRRL